MKKHLLKTFVAVVAVSAILFAACGKDDNGGKDDNEGGGTGSSPVVVGVMEGEWIDLGLPSGLLWYSCNLGATAPEGYGDYYAWGESTPKSVYDWSTYQYANGSEHSLTKYCGMSNFGYNGFTDSLTTLLTEDDAATQVLGSGARIPTKEEWQELMDNTAASRTQMNGVFGTKFTASNGNSIFLPAAGYRNGYQESPIDFGEMGGYWSSSLNIPSPRRAWYFVFGSDEQSVEISHYRYYGQSVRAVRASEN